jgi:hypothetical protein
MMAPVVAFRSYTLWSSDPTYTTAPATAGEERTGHPPFTKTQSRVDWFAVPALDC